MKWKSALISYPPVRRAIVFFAAVVAGLIVSVSFWLSTSITLRNLEGDLASLQSRRDELRAESDLAKIVAAKSTMITTLRQKLGATANQVDVMGNIQELASTCGIRILEHKTLDNEEVSSYDAERHMVSAEGEYGGIRRFLADLSPTLPFLTFVRSARLEKSASGKTVHAEVELISYLHTGGGRGE